MATYRFPTIYNGSSQDPVPDLAERVLEALRKTGYLALAELSVRMMGNEVVLKGHVPSYYLKQLAHNIVLDVPGIHTIIDDIEVIDQN